MTMTIPTIAPTMITATRIGISREMKLKPTLLASSAVLTTGAAVPIVAALITGRAADFVRCVVRAMSTPTATGIHEPDVEKDA